MGMKTAYFSINRFIEKITLSKLDGSYLKLLNHLERQALIILDDFSLQPMQLDVKLALLQIFEERHGKHATLIITQLPVSAWHEYINEPTVADAIMDRLTAGALFILLFLNPKQGGQHHPEYRGQYHRNLHRLNISTFYAYKSLSVASF